MATDDEQEMPRVDNGLCSPLGEEGNYRGGGCGNCAGEEGSARAWYRAEGWSAMMNLFVGGGRAERRMGHWSRGRWIGFVLEASVPCVWISEVEIDFWI